MNLRDDFPGEMLQSTKRARLGWPDDLSHSVAKVLDVQGDAIGTAFLVSGLLLVTCAHVVANAGAEVTAQGMLVEFPALGGLRYRARVDPALWHRSYPDDVAFLRLSNSLPSSARALRLGVARGVRSHRVTTYGFPANAPRGGHYGYGVAGGIIKGDRGSELLQLTQCTEVTEGFSGAPVLDELTGFVIGMVDSLADPDAHNRGRSTAYVTPAETLRKICVELARLEVCPYIGLRSFTSLDAPLFYGRKRAIDEVVANLRKNPSLLVLLGPSGSGKSSLVQAGILPTLIHGGLTSSDRWGCISARPGTDPYGNLAAAGLPGVADGLLQAGQNWLTANREFDRLVLVLDQFEEVLVTTTSSARAQLLDQLAEAIGQDAALSIVLVMRDDFYSTLAATAPRLMQLITPCLVNVPALLERDELMAIVEEPAVNAGFGLEPNLGERIVDDAMQVTNLLTPMRSGAMVTVLPLLSSALAELWSRRDGALLTHDAYDGMGGLAGWLDRWCERGYTEVLSVMPSTQAPLLQQILVSLVRPGNQAAHIPPTRQRRTLQHLLNAGVGKDAATGANVAAVVAALANQRLITTSRDSADDEAIVELAHEALIYEWHRLRGWVTHDEEFLIWRSELEKDYSRWRDASKGAPSGSQQLLTGVALETARTWRDRRPAELPNELSSFIDRSYRAERLRLSHDRRRAVTFAVLAIAASILAVMALGAAVVAWRQTAAARSARDLAIFNEDTAEANQLQSTDPTLAAQLDLITYHMRPNPETYTDLINTEGIALSTTITPASDFSDAGSISFSPDGQVLYAPTNTTDLWNLAEPLGISPIHLSLTGICKTTAVAFIPQGHTVAAIGRNGRFWRWNISRPGHPILVGQPSSVRTSAGVADAMMFSPNGRMFVTTEKASRGLSLSLWSVVNPSRPELIAESLTAVSSISLVAFSPNSGMLATLGTDGALQLWDLSHDERPESIALPKATSFTTGTSVEFSDNGDTLATINNQAVSLWNLANPRHPIQETRSLTGTSNVAAMAFSPSKQILVTESFDGAFKLWNIASAGRVSLLSEVGSADSTANISFEVGGSVVFGAEGRVLAVTSPDHTIRLWNLSDPATPIALGQPLIGNTSDVTSLTFSPAGSRIVSVSYDGAVRLWDLPKIFLIGRINALSVGFSPNGRLLASGSIDAVQLWNVGNLASPNPIGRPLITGPPYAGAAGPSVSFNSDGRVLATVGQGGTVMLWNIANPQQPSLLAHIPAGGNRQWANPMIAAVFSPKGSVLATADTFGNVRLWDLADTHDPIPFGTALDRSGGGPLAFSPDGRMLATDNPVLWGVINPRQPVRLADPVNHDVDTFMAFSPDGRTLAVANFDTVQLWNISNTNRPILLGKPLGGQTSLVTSVAFSRNGQVLASASQDGTIRLWSVANPDHVEPIGQALSAGSADAVNSIAFSPFGDTLAAGSADHIVRLWNLNTAAAIRRICATASSGVDGWQWRRYLRSAEATQPCANGN